MSNVHESVKINKDITAVFSAKSDLDFDLIVLMAGPTSLACADPDPAALRELADHIETWRATRNNPQPALFEDTAA